jgi:cytosine/adenosine deaminase-related metal-dependent hydrolase
MSDLARTGSAASGESSTKRAGVLGRDDIGVLAPRYAADVVTFDLRDVGFAGALHDPIAALVFCAPARCAWSMIDVRVVVCGGELQTVEVPRWWGCTMLSPVG